MLWMSFRRSTRFRLIRASWILFLIFCSIDLVWLSWILRQNDSALKKLPPVPTDRIYIASIHWNNEKILRSHWNTAVLDLVQHLGIDNVFVSVYESGSWDDSKGALRSLDAELQKLGVQREINMNTTTHQDEIERPPAISGWIATPRRKKELRRIPYLAKLRNLSMEPLRQLALKDVKFDKVLFLNDVIFNVG